MIINLEIILAVQDKTGCDAHQNRNAIGSYIMYSNILRKQGINTEIQERGATSNDSIKNQVAELEI